MQRSIFLTKLIGPLLFVIGASLIFNGEAYRAMAEQFLRNYALIYFSGIVVLLAGLAIINLHNIWSTDWRGAITIIGWLLVIGGVVRIAAPQHAAVIGAAELTYPGLLNTVGAVLLVLGAWLSFHGYGRAMFGQKGKGEK
jgi:vacuolar-type H+-ATPase subunit I/STV1